MIINTINNTEMSGDINNPAWSWFFNNDFDADQYFYVGF